MSASYDAGLETTSALCALHRNENQFVDRQWLHQLAEKALKSTSFFRYPDSQALRLRQAIGRKHGVNPDEVYVGHGADGVLADICQLLRTQYHEVGTTPITYPVYPYLCRRYGYTHVFLNERIPDLCVIDSPNSLTGECFDFSKLQTSFLIHDNVYGEFANDEIQRDLFGPNRVIIRSFSKFYALAGLRIGYCIADPSFIAKLMSQKDVFNIGEFAQEMAICALEETRYFETCLSEFRLAKDQLQTGLAALGFEHSNSKANFVWFRHPSFSSQMIARRLQDAQIFVRHFNEPQLQNYLRMTVPKLEHVKFILQILREL